MRTLACLMMLVAMGCTTPGDYSELSDLRSDDRLLNAERLWVQLSWTNAPPIAAREAALYSDDYQQRQLAASALRRHAADKPSTKLLEVTVEGLADDSLPRDKRPGYEFCIFLFNAAEGVTYLADHGKEARPYLLKGVRSDDLQMQFLCAYLLGIHGIRARLNETAPILIRHLRDNGLSGDAAAACSALYRLGDAAIPHLKNALPSDDPQQTELIGLLLKDLTNVPLTREERYSGGRDYGISNQARNPARQRVLPDFWFPDGKAAMHDAVFRQRSGW